MSESDKLSPINLASIARGAALELFDRAIVKVAANIADKDTPATKSRKITLTFTLKPDVERRSIDVTTSCDLKLAAVADHASRIYLGKDVNAQALLFDQDPHQELLFQPPEKQDNVLSFGAAPTA
jgi:flagellar basal body rod protein FlgB